MEAAFLGVPSIAVSMDTLGMAEPLEPGTSQKPPT